MVDWAKGLSVAEWGLLLGGLVFLVTVLGMLFGDNLIPRGIGWIKARRAESQQEDGVQEPQPEQARTEEEDDLPITDHSLEPEEARRRSFLGKHPFHATFEGFRRDRPVIEVRYLPHLPYNAVDVRLYRTEKVLPSDQIAYFGNLNVNDSRRFRYNDRLDGMPEAGVEAFISYKLEGGSEPFLQSLHIPFGDGSGSTTDSISTVRPPHSKTTDTRPYTEKQRQAIRDHIAESDPFIVQYVMTRPKSYTKLDATFWNDYDLDALDVVITFGEYEGIKLSGGNYAPERMRPKGPFGMKIVRTMGVPDEIPVQFEYSFGGDHRHKRYTYETTVQLF